MTNEATILTATIAIVNHWIAPDHSGLQVVTVRCEDDYETFKTLPSAIEFNGVRYGKSGFNSDSKIAYYRNDTLLAGCC